MNFFPAFEEQELDPDYALELREHRCHADYQCYLLLVAIVNEVDEDWHDAIPTRPNITPYPHTHRPSLKP